MQSSHKTKTFKHSTTTTNHISVCLFLFPITDIEYTATCSRFAHNHFHFVNPQQPLPYCKPTTTTSNSQQHTPLTLSIALYRQHTSIIETPWQYIPQTQFQYQDQPTNHTHHSYFNTTTNTIWNNPHTIPIWKPWPNHTPHCIIRASYLLHLFTYLTNSM